MRMKKSRPAEAGPAPKVLSVEGLRKTYGATVAVDGVTFDVRPGEIVGLLGPNGAGKTTTINMILGVLEPTRVALAKAMLNRPRLLLLDEPTASLDPSSARDIRARMRAFAGGGDVGVLWTSHNMYEVEEVCDR